MNNSQQAAQLPFSKYEFLQTSFRSFASPCFISQATFLGKVGGGLVKEMCSLPATSLYACMVSDRHSFSVTRGRCYGGVCNFMTPVHHA